MTSESSPSKALHRFTTTCNELSDIGQRASSSRCILPDRRFHITDKLRLDHRVLYLSIHNDTNHGEIFLRVKGPDVTAETVALYDVIARLLSLSLQYGFGSRRWAISCLGPNLLHAGPSPDTIASNIAAVCRISLDGICCSSIAIERTWPMVRPPSKRHVVACFRLPASSQHRTD